MNQLCVPPPPKLCMLTCPCPFMCPLRCGMTIPGRGNGGGLTLESELFLRVRVVRVGPGPGPGPAEGARERERDRDVSCVRGEGVCRKDPAAKDDGGTPAS